MQISELAAVEVADVLYREFISEHRVSVNEPAVGSHVASAVRTALTVQKLFGFSLQQSFSVVIQAMNQMSERRGDTNE